MKEEQEEQQIIQASSTTNTYVFCWVAAGKALKSAQEVEQGKIYWRMMAGAFCLHDRKISESLGQRFVLDWNDSERKRLRRPNGELTDNTTPEDC